jgi:hypothetical protein
MMQAARASETSVDIQLRTRQYIPEDSELHTRRRENLKSHNLPSVSKSIVCVFPPFLRLLSLKQDLPVLFHAVQYRVSRIKRNPCLGREFFLKSRVSK